MIAEPRAGFVKDLKRRGLTPEEREILQGFLTHINEDADLVELYGEHALREEWAGYLECHLAGDWLVIYKRLKGRIVLYRCGTHAELFLE